MTGIERITAALAGAGAPGLMTHLVGGYPDIETSRRLLQAQQESGAALVEVQLPFSEPLADGPAIIGANHRVLSSGIGVRDVLAMLAETVPALQVPVLVMSYLNPLVAFGIEAFLDAMVQIGLAGLIVPDLPLEAGLALPEEAAARGLAFVPLVTPFSGPERTAAIAARFRAPFVYAVLRAGVTGRASLIDEATCRYLAATADAAGLPVAAGFGIRSADQVRALAGHAALAIVGSGQLAVIGEALAQGRDPVAAAREFLAGLQAGG